ncbi:hypothetical protein [Nocardioides sp.]|uniref:hypothetical protein n=1 Tax=Nocardioides sp. TaxID=35761 RepID=UPI002C55259D|nr:hypothetical protein [Nocardioides sp.]HVX56078.1 hypothetical protein [Nocardioides sp.]
MAEPSRSPLTIGLAITALHVIHIVEYCRAHNLELDHLLAREAPQSPRTMPWIRRTCEVLGSPEPVTGRFVLTGEESSLQDDFEIVERLLAGEGDRPIRIVSGGFHLPFLWFLVERYADRIEGLVLVDEGVGTFASPIGNRNLVPELLQQVHSAEFERAFQAFSTFPATFYSRYPLSTQLRSIDVLEPVDPSVLAGLLELGQAVASPAVYFVGSPLHVLLGDPGRDVELTSLALHLVRRQHPGADVVYIPHRDEQPEKLHRLEALVEVRPLGHPIELEGLISGVAPKRLATFNSSAAISYGMIDRDVEIDVFVVPDELLGARYVEPVHAGQALFERLLEGQVAFHSLDTVAVPDYSLLPIVDVTVVLGSDGEANLQPKEVALEQAAAQVAFARRLDADGRLIYVPELGESAWKREELAGLVEVEQRALPAELLPFEWGFVPRRVVTLRAASLAKFAGAARGEVVGWVLRPPRTGYDLEEAALDAAHQVLRDQLGDSLRWEALPVESVPAEEALIATQRRYTRDVAALRGRIEDLERQLAAATHLAEERLAHIGEIGRSLRQHDPVIRSMTARIEELEKQNAKLRATRARLRRRLEAAEQRPRQRSTRLRRLLGRLGVPFGGR